MLSLHQDHDVGIRAYRTSMCMSALSPQYDFTDYVPLYSRHSITSFSPFFSSYAILQHRTANCSNLLICTWCGQDDSLKAGSRHGRLRIQSVDRCRLITQRVLVKERVSATGRLLSLSYTPDGMYLRTKGAPIQVASPGSPPSTDSTRLKGQKMSRSYTPPRLADCIRPIRFERMSRQPGVVASTHPDIYVTLEGRLVIRR